MIRTIVSTFFYFFSFFKKRDGVVVLMYHRVNDTLPANDLVVPVAKFREQMLFLKQHYRVIGLNELLQKDHGP